MLKACPLFLICLAVAIAPACRGLRSTHPVRRGDGKDAEIPIERVAEETVVDWRIVELDTAIEALPDGRKRNLSNARRQLLKEDPWSLDSTTHDQAASTETEVVAKLPHGDYGGVYLLQVKETRMKGEVRDVVRNTVRVLDDREPALAVGTHVGLLFIPDLDGVLTSTQVSLYPARLAAIDRYKSTNLSWLTDGLSIDAGVVGGSVIGDAPPELAGRIGFTFGGGYQFAKGWAVKTGVVVYRDATDGDDLSSDWYVGTAYDLLSGFASDPEP